MKKKNKTVINSSLDEPADGSEELPTETVETDEPSIDDWPELASLSIEQMVSDGWIPRVKTMTNGKQGISLRLVSRDEFGKRHDQERGLGAYSDDRWTKLLTYFPKLTVGSATRSEALESKGSSILSTKVDKPRPLSSTIHLELETLHWYMWAQQKAGYPGTLEQFINQCVNGYFHDYHKLELAVISEKVIKCQ